MKKAFREQYLRPTPTDSSTFLKKLEKRRLNIIDKEVISYVLNQTGWNRTRASKILQISYKTLLNKISDLDIKSC